MFRSKPDPFKKYISSHTVRGLKTGIGIHSSLHIEDPTGGEGFDIRVDIAREGGGISLESHGQKLNLNSLAASATLGEDILSWVNTVRPVRENVQVVLQNEGRYVEKVKYMFKLIPKVVLRPLIKYLKKRLPELPELDLEGGMKEAREEIRNSLITVILLDRADTYLQEVLSQTDETSDGVVEVVAEEVCAIRNLVMRHAQQHVDMVDLVNLFLG